MSWWRSGVIYEIYVRSFADSDGDGIGDLAGILGRLDHLRGAPGSLGIDAIWLTPIHPSPLADMGYDVADYEAIDPVYGDLATFDRLVAACHERGIRVILDLVLCHTSVEHPWFVAARSSRADPHRDWYIWADPAPDGGPPNDWLATFGGPAWLFDEGTGQFYLHTFFPEQADLDWRNPGVVAAMSQAFRFWRARGVDGFRLDAFNVAIKDDALRDNPPTAGPTALPYEREHYPIWNSDRPEVLDVARALRQAASEGRPEPLLLGETYVPLERLGRYLGERPGDALDLALDFEFLKADWEADAFRFVIDRAEGFLPVHGWPCRALSSHDLPRHATRYGQRTLRAAAVLLLTLRGTPIVYMGEEIGMADVKPPAGVSFDRAGRDGCRSPMQWDAGPGGGFTSGTPWLPLGDIAVTNVAEQRDDAASLLSLYRRLIDERHASPALGQGTQRSLHTGPESGVLAYLREATSERSGAERLLIAIEFAGRASTIDARAAAHGRIPRQGRLRLSTNPARAEGSSIALEPLELAPGEAVIVQL